MRQLTIIVLLESGLAVLLWHAAKMAACLGCWAPQPNMPPHCQASRRPAGSSWPEAIHRRIHFTGDVDRHTSKASVCRTKRMKAEEGSGVRISDLAAADFPSSKRFPAKSEIRTPD